MDQVAPGNLSGDEGDASSDSNNLHDNEVIPWYFSREEIEINSPSRQDGIDLNKETRLRNSYLRFFSKLGVKLKVPKITTATAIVYCHRFFLRQSHAKNDIWTISTACMFLAGKVEESLRFLKEVIIASYEILHNKELASAERKEVYQQQKELVKTAELLVLSTLNFDLSIGHPFKPLMDAIQKYKVEEAKTQFPRVAICLVSDSYKTTLCLQYKPRKIAAGAFFLAAELLKMDLQTYGEGLWQDFDVTLTHSQLEDIRGQMRELYEKKDTPTSQGSTVKGGEVQQPISRDMASTDKCSTSDIEGGANLEMIIQSTEAIDLNEFGKDNSESEAGENQEKGIDGSD